MNRNAEDLAGYAGWSGDVNELARLAGEILAARGLAVAGAEPTVRVIRDYAQRGIISRPGRQGKEAVYGYRQLLELVAARVLIGDGWPLAKISEHLALIPDQELLSLIQGAQAPAAADAGSNPALALARRLRGEAERAASAQPPAPARAAASLGKPAGASSQQFRERAARYTGIQAELREALRKLGLPEDGPASEQVTLIAIAPWCQVLVESRRLARLTLEEAEEIGRAVTAALLAISRKGHKP